MQEVAQCGCLTASAAGGTGKIGVIVCQSRQICSARETHRSGCFRPINISGCCRLLFQAVVGVFGSRLLACSGYSSTVHVAAVSSLSFVTNTVSPHTTPRHLFGAFHALQWIWHMFVEYIYMHTRHTLYMHMSYIIQC